MIKKTEEFDIKLHNDFFWININRNKSLKVKGSYKIKKNGDILSDIDIQCNVYFNEKLLQILYNVINKNKSKNSPFTFIHLIVGKYKEFILPWILDNEGECYYNVEKTKDWVSTIKKEKLVPELIIKYIEEKLFSSNITISNLIDIEYKLYLYSDILWEQTDILKGYKDVRGIRYNLLDEIKTEIPVMEFIYKYENEYINIDFALFDHNFIIIPENKLYPYYTNNFYKIMKVFRWKLKPEYKEEYFLTMKKSEELISIKYQIDTIQNILLHNSKRYGQNKINMDLLLNKMYNNLYINLINIGIEKKSLSLDEISDELDEKINVIFKDNIYYYLDKLINKEDSIQIIKKILIGKKAQKPISQQQLLESKNSCPFF